MADGCLDHNKDSRAKLRKCENSGNKSHTLRKRAPRKAEQAKNVIYVNTRTHLKVFAEKCLKLIQENCNEIIIYCLGASIPRGILLALQVCETHPLLTIATNTLTTEIIDDLEPITDEADFEIQKRQNSALKICLRLPDNKI